MELTPVSGLSCEQLAGEQDRVDRFRAAIDEKDDWDARTASSFWMDFGYGNHRDKKKALRSAADREAQIAQARSAQGCPSDQA